jgi:hypothetical protein
MGNPVILEMRQQMAQNGRYFTASNPTISTFPQAATTTSFTNTVALFAIQNIAPPGQQSPITVWLDYLKLMLGGTAPTATVSMEFAIYTDPANRNPSAGGTSALQPVNVNGNDPTQSNARVYAFTGNANLTVPAPGPLARLAGRAKISTGLGIVGDEYELRFAGVNACPIWQGGAAVRATDPARRGSSCSPIGIGPQQWAVIHMWWLTSATTAPSFEYELGMFENP